MNNDVSVILEGELTPKGHFTLDEHVVRIKEIQTRIKRNIFELANAVRDAYVQLDEGSVKELASQLGMGRSTLYQWKSIAESKFLIDHQHILPDVFTSLYKVVTLEEKLKSIYSTDDEVYQHLNGYVQDGLFHQTMKIAEVNNLIFEVDKVITNRLSKSGAKKKRSIFGNKQLASNPIDKNITDLITSGDVFKTFYIEPHSSLLQRFSAQGIFEEDIYAEFPIADLRDITGDGSIMCVVKVSNKYVPVGLMMLSAFGFSYSDIYSLPQKNILLIGFRGRPLPIVLNQYTPIHEQLEAICNPPFISIWHPVNLPNWSCAK